MSPFKTVITKGEKVISADEFGDYPLPEINVTPPDSSVAAVFRAVNDHGSGEVEGVDLLLVREDGTKGRLSAHTSGSFSIVDGNKGSRVDVIWEPKPIGRNLETTPLAHALDALSRLVRRGE